MFYSYAEKKVILNMKRQNIDIYYQQIVDSIKE